MNRQRIKRLLCRHYRVTYHGHPDAPRGLCLDCGALRKPRKVHVRLPVAERPLPQPRERVRKALDEAAWFWLGE